MPLRIKHMAGKLPSNQTSYADLTAAVTGGKAQLIKNMRFFNISGAARIVTVGVLSTNPAPFSGTDVKTILIKSINPNEVWVEYSELTLEETQKLQYKTDGTAGSNVFDFVISAFERDV